MKRKTLLLVFTVLLLSRYSYGYDCREFLGTWDVTITFQTGGQAYVGWIFTQAAQDAATGYTTESTPTTIQVVWSEPMGQYRLFYPEEPSNGNTWISLLGDTLVGTNNDTLLGLLTYNGTRRPPVTTTTTTSVNGGGICPAKTILGNENPHIKTLRAFRNQLFIRSTAGKYYTALYYKHSFELSYIFANDEALRERAYSFVQKIMPTVDNFLSKRKALISEDAVKKSIGLIDALESQASPSLEKDLKHLKKDIQSGLISRILNSNFGGF